MLQLWISDMLHNIGELDLLMSAVNIDMSLVLNPCWLNSESLLLEEEFQ